MALQALRDWSTAGTERPAPDDACAPCCDDLKTPAEMLAAIARIFGWTPDDWKLDEKSDFAWVCHGEKNLLTTARALLPPHDTSSGTIAFLAASPNTDPGLELDVLTPHHTKYHAGEKGYQDAPDTEDPVPVFFPTVKPQKETDHFTFPLIPLRRARTDDLQHAKTWLAHGLELLGIGAKTHAGYGFFEVLEDGSPAYPDRFAPILSPVEAFLKHWGNKPVNGMNARSFAKQIISLTAAELVLVFQNIAPGKIADLKDPFWNPFKTDPTGKVILETLRNHPISQ